MTPNNEQKRTTGNRAIGALGTLFGAAAIVPN